MSNFVVKFDFNRFGERRDSDQSFCDLSAQSSQEEPVKIIDEQNVANRLPRLPNERVLQCIMTLATPTVVAVLVVLRLFL